jgi:Flp pilus assembly protein TadG
MTPFPIRTATRRRLSRFGRESSGASAVEFALVCGPFFILLLYFLQIGLYYMTQSALNTGLIKTADEIRNSFNYATSPVFPSAETLKDNIATKAHGLITKTDPSFAVEIRPMAALSGAVVPITDGVNDYGGSDTRSVLVLRAQTPVVAIAPGFSNLTKVTAAVLLRRQGR